MINQLLKVMSGLRRSERTNMEKLRNRLKIMSVETIKSRIEAYEAWKNRKKLSHEASLRVLRGPFTRNVARGLIIKRPIKDWLREAFNHLSPTLRSV